MRTVFFYVLMFVFSVYSFLLLPWGYLYIHSVSPSFGGGRGGLNDYAYALVSRLRCLPVLLAWLRS